MRTVLTALAAGLLAAAAGAASAQPTDTVRPFDFAAGSAGWRVLRAGRLTDEPCPVGAPCEAAASCLRVDCRLPGTSGAGVPLRGEEGDWHGFTGLSLRLFVPADAPGALQAIVYMKDNDLFYYQHLRRVHLPPGAWAEMDLDLTARSADWEPAGHYKPWDGYCRRGIREFGVKFISRERYEGSVFVDSPVLARDPDELPTRNAIYNLHANTVEVGRYEKFELSFNLARTYHNPFDSDEVDVRGRFVRPDGTEVVVPGFFYQGYLRRMQQGAERLMPMGRSQWKIRFAPMQLGTYHYYVEVRDGEGLRSELGTFRCVPSECHGFVRISEADPDCLEFDDGTFYYPIGHNIAAVDDTRAHSMGVGVPAEQRTYAYDRFLTRMGKNGINFGRVWMSPWNLGIEWSEAYDSQFRGLGRYSLQNAWRVDHVVETARRNGVYLMLLFTSHGELGEVETNFYGGGDEAQGSPYWSKLGGPLDDPLELYESPEALDYYKRKARYIVARWGYATSIMAWELLNEVDLGFFRKPNSEHYGRTSARFVQQVLRHISRHDPPQHLTTSGFVWHRRPFARPTLKLEEMSIYAAHIFDQSLAARLAADREFIREQFGKLMLVTEAGATPFATDPELTARRMRHTLWTSHMLPMAGAACPWWWVLIDQHDLYPTFGALAAFAAGEDRRGMGYAPAPAHGQEAGERKRRLHAHCLRNEERGFCWLYDPAHFSQHGAWSERQPRPARLRVPGLRDGLYRVEVWDTREGSIVADIETPVRGGELAFELPPFEADVACKFMRTGEVPAPSPTPGAHAEDADSADKEAD
jgi:hypothetical protein